MPAVWYIRDLLVSSCASWGSAPRPPFTRFARRVEKERLTGWIPQKTSHRTSWWGISSESPSSKFSPATPFYRFARRVRTRATRSSSEACAGFRGFRGFAPGKQALSIETRIFISHSNVRADMLSRFLQLFDWTFTKKGWLAFPQQRRLKRNNFRRAGISSSVAWLVAMCLILSLRGLRMIRNCSLHYIYI